MHIDHGNALSAQLRRAARQLGALINAGEFGALTDDTKVTVRAFGTFLLGASDLALDQEDQIAAGRPRRRLRATSTNHDRITR